MLAQQAGAKVELIHGPEGRSQASSSAQML